MYHEYHEQANGRAHVRARTYVRTHAHARTREYVICIISTCFVTVMCIAYPPALCREYLMAFWLMYLLAKLPGVTRVDLWFDAQKVEPFRYPILVLSANGCAHPPTQQSPTGPVGLFTRSCSDNPAPLALAVDYSIYNAANSHLNHMQVVAGGRFAEPRPGQPGQLAPYGNGIKTKTITRPNLTSVRSSNPICPVV